MKKFYSKAETKEEIRKLLKEKNKRAIDYSYLAYEYQELGERGKAIFYHKKALQLDPRDVINYSSLVLLYLESKQYQKALYLAKRAVKLDRKGYLMLGNVYFDLARRKWHKKCNKREARLMLRHVKLAHEAYKKAGKDINDEMTLLWLYFGRLLEKRAGDAARKLKELFRASRKEHKKFMNNRNKR